MSMNLLEGVAVRPRAAAKSAVEKAAELASGARHSERSKARSEEFGEIIAIRTRVLSGEFVSASDPGILTHALFFTCATTLANERDEVRIRDVIMQFVKLGASLETRDGRTLSNELIEIGNHSGASAARRVAALLASKRET